MKRKHLPAAMAAAFLGISVAGQPATPAFEVASIRVHAPNTGVHSPGCSNNRFTSIAFPLPIVIAWAYDLKGDASREFFKHNPPVIGKNYYDIQAEAADPVTESQCRLMVQALLADRFKLAVHWESREAEIFDLVVAPGGPRMQTARETDEGTDLNVVVDGRPLRRPPGPEPDPKGWTMQELAEFLTGRRAFQPIVDKTGLEGRYKIDLRYSTGLPSAPAGPLAARLGLDAPPPPAGDAPLDPELEKALPQQLGLRLEKHKGSVRIMVLDHIEPPTAN
jgi:uncharacterized protein (TIGR03435 family)